jgi:hypothetical protein
MERDYWQKRVDQGWKNLMSDINSLIYGKKEPIKTEIKRDEQGTPLVVNTINNYPTGKQFQHLGFWKTVFLIVFLSMVVVTTYYIITEPEALIIFGNRLGGLFKKIVFFLPCLHTRDNEFF